MPKTLYISKIEKMITICIESPDMQKQDTIKLFTYNEGWEVMAKIAVEFLNGKKEV